MLELENPFNLVVPSNACSRCFNSGIWLTPLNHATTCPRIICREPHAGINEASKLLKMAALLLGENKHWISELAFDLARILTNYNSENPCSRSALLETFFGDTNFSEAHKLRRFHYVIEELRKDWLLPIGSRKTEPSGYWIITDLEDFKQWYQRVKAAPITQLSTIHKVARRNFPIFAEQIELDFQNQLLTEEPAQ